MTSREMFDKIIPVILKHEGGYVNHPKDPGGETKYGIAKRYNPGVDIKNLTVSKAKDIYFKKYWTVAKCDKIQDERLRETFFDMTVNLGKYRATQILQQSLKELGQPLQADGILGQHTEEAIKLIKPEILVSSYKQNLEEYYRDLVTKSPSKNVFLKGWLNRLYGTR
jgi:lysozyme family protein